MARIPTVESTGQITTQAPAVRQEGGIFSTAVAKASQGLADTVAEVAFQFEEAQTLKETTDATTLSKRRIAELQLEADTTDDIVKFEKDYKNRVFKIREEATKGISLPQAKNDFNRAFERDSVVADFNTRSILRRRQVDAMKVTMLEGIDALKDNSLDRDTELEKLLAENTSKRVITGEQGFKLREATIKSWQESDIRNAIASDAETAKRRIIDGEFGELSASETADWLKAADTKVERNTEEAKKGLNIKQSENETAFTDKLLNNQLTVNEVQKGFASGTISPEMAKAYNNSITSPDSINAKTDDKIGNKLTDDYYTLDESDLDKKRAFMASVLNESANGNISIKDRDLLLNRLNDLFTPQKAEKKGFIDKAIETIKSSLRFGGGDFGLELSIMVDNLESKVDQGNLQGKAIEELTKDIIKEKVQRDYPDIGVLTDIPNSVLSTEKGFDNVSNAVSKAEAEWEFVDGKLIRTKTKEKTNK